MASGVELQDSLDTNAQSLQLLPDYVLGHLSAQILIEQMYTTILRERGGVKTLTLVPIKGSQCADRRSEAVTDSWEKHQPLPLILG
jgi:hypothetical protein